MPKEYVKPEDVLRKVQASYMQKGLVVNPATSVSKRLSGIRGATTYLMKKGKASEIPINALLQFAEKTKLAEKMAKRTKIGKVLGLGLSLIRK